MTADQFQERASGRAPLYGEDFAADPGRTYAELRKHGVIAPVELAPGVPASLVIGYDTALEVLRDPGTFPRDARRWQAKQSPDNPLLPMMAHRDHALYSDGDVHARLRRAIADSLNRIDSTLLRGYVENAADDLIDKFEAAGEAELMTQYTRVLPLLVFNELFGCPPDIGERLVYGVSRLLDGVDVEHANAMFMQAAGDLVALKREKPRADVASWLVNHPARLNDEELTQQIALLLGTGTEPEQNLIAGGVRLLLSDDRFGGDLSGGNMQVDDALDEVLWTDPPLSNFAWTFPRRDVDLGGHRLPADEPVVISYAAANTDPSRGTQERIGNRAHLAWSAGPHTCPAKGQARVIASVAIEKLLDRLPGLELAVPVNQLQWRHGPFHRGLIALPVRFPPAPSGAMPYQGAPPRG